MGGKLREREMEAPLVAFAYDIHIKSIFIVKWDFVWEDLQP